MCRSGAGSAHRSRLGYHLLKSTRRRGQVYPRCEKLKMLPILQKALRLTAHASIFIQAATTLCDQLMDDHKEGKASPAVELVLVGQFQELAEQFFEDGAPIVGDGDRENICWRTTLTDETGSIPVKVWDKAAAIILGCTASALRTLWEEGNVQPEKQEKLLSDINKHLADKYECVCSASIWTYGYKVVKYSVQVNVNRAAKSSDHRQDVLLATVAPNAEAALDASHEEEFAKSSDHRQDVLLATVAPNAEPAPDASHEEE